MSNLLSSRRRMVARFGRPMTLRRQTGVNPATYVELPVRAGMSLYRPEGLAGGVQQGDGRVVLLPDEVTAASWPPPRARDAIVIDGKQWQVIGAPPAYDGPTLLGWDLWVRGGAL